MNLNYTQAARQDAGGRLLPSLIFALGDYAALAVAGGTGSISEKLRYDLQYLPPFHGLPFSLAAHGFYVFYFL